MSKRELSAAKKDTVSNLSQYAIAKGDKALRDVLALVDDPTDRFVLATMVSAHFLAASAGLFQASGRARDEPLIDAVESVASAVIQLLRDSEAGRLALSDHDGAPS